MKREPTKADWKFLNAECKRLHKALFELNCKLTFASAKNKNLERMVDRLLAERVGEQKLHHFIG